nr:hypothetical protein [Tanacetum cinerariifolium]
METFRIELILFDEEANKIQATVKNTCVKNHEKSLGQDMTTRLKKCNDFSGPVYGINFKSFTDLLQERQDSTFAYDLIGDITSCGKIETQREKGGKLKFLKNLGGKALDHQIISLVKYDRYDIRQDFLVKLQKVNLADIRDIVEIKSVVVVTTIKVIEHDNKWYYLACGSCNRIVDEKTVDKKDSDSGELKKHVVFVCSNKECGEVTNVRYKVASKLLNRTAEEFIREMRKINAATIDIPSMDLNGSDDEVYDSRDDAMFYGTSIGSSKTKRHNSVEQLIKRHYVKYITPKLCKSSSSDQSSLTPANNKTRKNCYNNMTPLPSSSTRINHLSSDETTNTSRRSTNKGKSVANFDISRMNLNNLDEDANDLGIDDMFYGTSIEYLDHRDPTVTCGACGAVFKVMLLKCKDAPQALLDLYRNNDSISKNFLKNIRTYNMMFSFTSMGGKFDHSINRGNARYCFRLYGQNYHNYGSLLPLESSTPKFAQLYIYDTENEVQNRISGLRRQSDSKEYNLPTTSEVAALIVGDIAQSLDERDIIIETKLGNMQRINVLHRSFLSLQYPLLFPYGEDNYRTDILHRDVIDLNTKKHVRLTMMEYMAYLVQERPNQFSLIHHARRLFQQFLVDIFTMIETERLYFHRSKQKVLRCESYQNLASHIDKVVYTIKFQKHGLPHSHICIFIHRDDKIRNNERIDDFILAKIPNEEADPQLYKLVSDHMMHGPCGPNNPSCSCTIQGKCTKKFLKKYSERTSTDSDGYPVYKRRDDGKFVEKSGVKLDNRFVVGYNSFLLKKYQAHIHVEYCNQAEYIKYLFKYINKGPDRVTAICTDNNQTENANDDEVVDEIKDYYDCTYLSACEACWRIFGNEVHYRFSAVERLPFHLPGQQQVVYEADADITDAIDKPSVASLKFLGWMECDKTNDLAKTLTYVEFLTKFVWKAEEKVCQQRKRGFAVGRIHYIPPSVGEAYYLRVLLHKQKDDDREYIDAIDEANSWACGEYVRKVFARLLTSNTISRPDHVWNETWRLMCDDIEYEQQLELRDTHLKNLCLQSIDSILRTNGSSLDSFPGMPLLDMEFIRNHTNILIHDELCYNKDELVTEHETLFLNLTTEQKNVYTKVLTTVEKKARGVFFVYGYGGTGKTYVWRTLSASLRSKGEIILNVASSGIALLLLSGGRTAHSRFAIPINVNEESFCSIKLSSDLAALLEKKSLIIWDEAPMMHKHCFESLDRTLRDILGIKNKKAQDIPFGGKVIVFGGDFGQILPVIPRGDGKLGGPNDGEAVIDIPDDLLIKDSYDPVGSLVQSVYPSILDNLNDPTYFQERAILALTHDVVEVINKRLLDLIPGKEKVYYSSNNICESEGLDDNFHESLYSLNILNGLKLSGIMNHRLALKVGAPVMLLRNIDQSAGLCNGTRLRITKLGKRCIEAEIITETKVGEKFILTRMKLSPLDKNIPFKINRRQFPISVCFAMTINKSQGQSLTNVGIFLPKPMFTHGQLYVAVSRVKSRKGLKVLMYDKEGKVCNTTMNVVYYECL